MSGYRFKRLGAYLCGACVMPLYYFWQNYPHFSVVNISIVIASLLLGCWLVSKLVHLFIKDEDSAIFWLFAIYGTFWLGWSVASFLLSLLAHCPILYDWLSQHRWALLTAALLVGGMALCLFLKKAKKYVATINQACAVFCCLSVGWMLFRTAFEAVVLHRNQEELRRTHPKSNLPNIYHILLDAHPNQKAMELLGGDLRPFYKELEKLGFITFPESMSNYSGTTSSVSSMFDMDYLTGKWAKKWMDGYAFAETIRTRKVFQKLEPLYSFRVLNAQYTDFMYKSFLANMVKSDYSFFKICALVFYKAIFQLNPRFRHNRFVTQMDRQEILDLLSRMPTLKQQFGSSGNFFHHHILCPHLPFVFGSMEDILFCEKFDWEHQTANPETCRMFKPQTEGIDQAILPVLKTILAQYQNEPIQPIIILHSDHGYIGRVAYMRPFAKTKYFCNDNIYGNLLALYIPDSWKKDAQNLTFINLYRFVLNHLLGEHYPYIKENKQVQFELSEH